MVPVVVGKNTFIWMFTNFCFDGKHFFNLRPIRNKKDIRQINLHPEKWFWGWTLVMSSSRAGSSHSSSWSIFSLARLGSWPFSFSSNFFFQLENQKIAIFCHPDFFFPYFTCIFTLFSTYCVANDTISL